MVRLRRARILIVDDSAVMRSLLRSVLDTDSRLETAGTALDGAAALRAVENLRPDLVLLDVEMPGMDGLSTLKQMRACAMRVPVIMCSSLTQRGARVTIEALASGAADYVAKPSGQPSRDAAIQALARELVPKILALTGPRLVPATVPSAHLPGGVIAAGPAIRQPGRPPLLDGVRPAGLPSVGFLQPIPAPPSGPASPHGIAAVVIGVSTGGPAALDVILPRLPADFPVPVLIVQHMPELFTRMLAERLDGHCPMRVCEAVSGEPIRAGTIYIAKGDWHMEVISMTRGSYAGPAPAHASTPMALRLQREAPENHCRPAADVLFRSAAAVYDSALLAVVLTGMGSDGLAGCRLIRQHNGTVLVQDEATSAVWGMPAAVAHAGLAHKVLALPLIASEILRLVGRGQREASELRESVV